MKKKEVIEALEAHEGGVIQNYLRQDGQCCPLGALLESHSPGWIDGKSRTLLREDEKAILSHVFGIDHVDRMKIIDKNDSLFGWDKQEERKEKMIEFVRGL